MSAKDIDILEFGRGNLSVCPGAVGGKTALVIEATDDPLEFRTPVALVFLTQSSLDSFVSQLSKLKVQA